MNIPLFIKTFWEWLVILLVVGIIIGRIKLRKYFWKAKDGSQLTIKQFFKRWGKGIEGTIDGITALQQTKSQMWLTWGLIGGMASGLVMNLLLHIKNQWWWISIILASSLLITCLSMVSLYQKYKILKKVEDTMKEIENKLMETI